MTLSDEDRARLERSEARSHERSAACLKAFPADLNARDDRIRDELAQAAIPARAKLNKVFRLMDAAVQATAPYVACRKGCSACCHMNVSISAIEAERLAVASGRRMSKVKHPTKHDLRKFSGNPCPFLSRDGVCSVYDDRPFACRAHQSFDLDNYWCQPERSQVAQMGQVKLGGAYDAYMGIVLDTKLGGFADIRDFFPNGA